MRQKSCLLLTLVAWLFATGSQWDLVQTYAWARMFANYAQTLSWSEAVQSTFDADKPCELCRAVSKAKKQQEDPATPSAKGAKKIELSLPVAARWQFARLEQPSWEWSDRECSCRDRGEPPSPPPRFATT